MTCGTIEEKIYRKQVRNSWLLNSSQQFTISSHSMLKDVESSLHEAVPLGLNQYLSLFLCFFHGFTF